MLAGSTLQKIHAELNSSKEFRWELDYILLVWSYQGIGQTSNILVDLTWLLIIKFAHLVHLFFRMLIA